ncbi:helix-turn-helix domain-containing protein [Nocardia altamirensis]|uniref:helix-turn-helix domain-containing protein n=1 Tax=Nocardia altamirensis TaxID=472158 RepID=UPI000840413E|nr:helix-turn-helix transcriptional regulator [Nocardia altamirensis]
MSTLDIDNSALARRVGARLRQIRADRGLTLAALSRSCGVSVSYLSAVEKGTNQPSLHRLAAITEALGVSILEVVVDEQQAPIRRARLPERTPGTVEIAHQRLALRGCIVSARAGERGACPLDLDDHDLFLYVVVGTLAVTVNGAAYDLAVGDALDAARPQQVSWHSSTSSTVLWAASPVRPWP